MKITVHEVECYVGYARPIFRGIDRAAVDAEIAKICRKDWASKDWESYWEERQENRSSPPPIPRTDQEVIATYFNVLDGDEDDEDLPDLWLSSSTFELDLSAPAGVPIDLWVDGYFSVTRMKPQREKSKLIPVSAVTEGTLLRDTGTVGDALEGFIMALTAAGFPVHVPEFKACLKEYCENLVNQLDEADGAAPEFMELALSNAGLLIGVDRAYDSWVVNRLEGESCVLVKNQPARGFKTRREAVEFAYELTLE